MRRSRREAARPATTRANTRPGSACTPFHMAVRDADLSVDDLASHRRSRVESNESGADVLYTVSCGKHVVRRDQRARTIAIRVHTHHHGILDRRVRRSRHDGGAACTYCGLARRFTSQRRQTQEPTNRNRNCTSHCRPPLFTIGREPCCDQGGCTFMVLLRSARSRRHGVAMGSNIVVVAAGIAGLCAALHMRERRATGAARWSRAPGRARPRRGIW